MPHLRGITVYVTDSQGKNLQEWGIQYLRQHTETNRVSAYIQSTTDVSFQVSLQPEIPFPPPDTLRGENVSTKSDPDIEGPVRRIVLLTKITGKWAAAIPFRLQSDQPENPRVTPAQILHFWLCFTLMPEARQSVKSSSIQILLTKISTLRMAKLRSNTGRYKMIMEK